jgi:hypothetical protein
MGIFDIFKKSATDKIKADVYVEENKLVIPREKLDVIIDKAFWAAHKSRLFYGCIILKLI